MDARQKRLILLFVGIVLVGGLVPSATEQQPGSSAATAPARRIVSLVPALTEMLFAIGAGPQVVAVSSFDDFPPEVKSLPRVGALLDPDVERILTLRPDLVITYGSQGSVEAQLARAGIKTFSYRHGGVMAILQTLRELGTATGRVPQAEGKTREIEAKLNAVRATVRGYARPRVLLVFGRQPRSLRQMYASGGVGLSQRHSRGRRRPERLLRRQTGIGTTVAGDVACASARRHHRDSVGTIRWPQRMPLANEAPGLRLRRYRPLETAGSTSSPVLSSSYQAPEWDWRPNNSRGYCTRRPSSKGDPAVRKPRQDRLEVAKQPHGARCMRQLQVDFLEG